MVLLTGFTPHLMMADVHRLESFHYSCLRIIVKNYKQRISRDWIDATSLRLPPKQCGKFAAVSLAIKIRQTQMPQKLHKDIFKNTYNVTRKPGRLFGCDNSNTVIGRAMTRNWIGLAFGHIQSSWTDTNLSNDQIRRMLKKTF